MRESIRAKAVIIVLVITSIVFIIGVVEYANKAPEGFAIGDHLANVVMPFVTLVGSVIVYYAFVAQLDANEEIRRQFKIQSFESLFFRLVDTLTARITEYELKEINSDERHAGFHILAYFSKNATLVRNLQRTSYGLSFLIKDPQRLTDALWTQFWNESNGQIWESPEKLKEGFLKADLETRKRIVEHETYNEHNDVWDTFLLNVFNSDILLQDRHFYTGYYIKIAAQIFNQYGTFFDSYFKTLKLILLQLEKQESSEFYADYLTEHLTSLEKVIILLYVGTDKGSSEFKAMVKKYKILDSLKNVRGIRNELDGDDEYLRHIHYLLDN